MKVLTLTQPWASAVVYRLKENETRSWRTKYTGPILIHAAAGMDRDAKDFLASPFCQDAFNRLAPNAQLHRGMILGYAWLQKCVPTEEIKPTLSLQEFNFGNYGPGRWAWKLWRIGLFAEAIPAKGSLGLWEFPVESLPHGLCRKCEVMPASVDYNGHGHLVCRSCYDSLTAEFEEEFK